MHHHLGRLYLVRHGETDWNRERRFQGVLDQPLNDLGRAQARALAARLRATQFDAIYSSPLSRAAETARIVADGRSIAPVHVADLRECDVGAWGGLTYPEVQARHGEDLARLEAGEDLPFAGRETRSQVHTRMTAALDHIGRRHAGATVLVVSHGLALKTAMCTLLGLDLRHADRLTTGGNTGLTVFEMKNGAPQMTVYADSRHLDGLAGA